MRSRILPIFFVALASFGWSMQACSDDASSGAGDDADASARDDAGSNDGDPRDAGSNEDATTVTDAGGEETDAATITDASDAATDVECTEPVAADLNGTEDCQSLDFGTPALAIVVSDPNGPKANGGSIPAGIYDVSRGERDSGKGAWRETLVFDGTNKFTRIRQIDTGTGNGLGPITHVSGTYATQDNEITFTNDCVSGGTGSVGGKTTLPYGVTTDACGRASFFFTATGIRITLTQR